MEWLSPPLDTPPESHALHRLSFDLIRASIIARQSASATCRALANAKHSDAAGAGPASTSATAPATAPALHLLSGAGRADHAQQPAGGSFAALFGHECSAPTGAPPDGEGKCNG